MKKNKLFILLSIFCFIQYPLKAQFILDTVSLNITGDTVGPLIIGEVNALLSDTANDRLIIAGDFNAVNGSPVCNIFSWDGANWDSLPGLAHDTSGIRDQITKLAILNNELYAAGDIHLQGDTFLYHLVRWNGSGWSAVPGSDQLSLGPPQLVFSDMLVYNNELYVSGQFDSIAGIPASGIASWDGNNWKAVGSGTMPTPYSFIFSLTVFNGTLHAGGVDVWNGQQIARWNGIKWDSVSTAPTPFEGVSLIHGYNGKLYASQFPFGEFRLLNAGVLDTLNPPFDPPGSLTSGLVADMEEYSDHLFLGGFMANPGGLSTWGLAVWNDTAWAGFGAGITGNVNTMAVFHQELYVGGGFKEADTLSVTNLVRIIDTTLSVVNPPTFLQELEAGSLVRFYPNPAQDYIQLTSDRLPAGDVWVEITDLQGKRLIERRRSVNDGRINERFGLTHLPSGLYLVRVLHGGRTIGSMKVVKD